MNHLFSANRAQAWAWLVLLLSAAFLAGCATSKKPSRAKLALIEQHQLAIHESTRAFWAGKPAMLTLPFGKIWAEKRDGSTYSGQVYFVKTGEVLAPVDASADTATVQNGELHLSQLHAMSNGAGYGYPSTVDPTTLIIRPTGSSVVGPMHFVTQPAPKS